MHFTTAGYPGALVLAAGIAVMGISAPDARAADVVKIGAPLALTGPLADEAKKQNVIWKMWLAKANAAGGINVGGKKLKAELVIYDYQSDGQRAGQLAEKLITDDKVDFLLAPFGSGHTKIVATIAERYETPVLACVSSSEAVFDFVADARNDPHWCPKVLSTDQAEGDRPAPGARYAVVHKPLPGRPPRQMTMVCRGFERPERIEWHEDDGKDSFTVVYTLQDLGGSTRFTQRSIATLSTPRLLAPLMRHGIGRDIAHQLKRLKQRLETA